MKHSDVLEENFFRDLKDNFLKGYNAQKLKQADPEDKDKLQAEIDRKAEALGMARLKQDIVKFARRNNTKIITKDLLVNFLKTEKFDPEVIAMVKDESTNIEDPVAIETRLRAALEASKNRAEETPEIKAGTEFNVRGRQFQWSGNQWVEAKGRDELGELDYSASGNVPAKTQKKITDLFKKSGGKDITGSIEKATEPTITQQPKAPSTTKSTGPKVGTDEWVEKLVGNVGSQQAQKIAMAILNKSGAKIGANQ